VLAHIGKADRQLFADLLAHRGADADLTRLGKRLQPRRDIDPIAEHVTLVDHYVAEIDADPEADTFGLRPISVAVRHSLLEDDGTAHSVDDRGELDQNAVAGGLEDTPAVLGDQWIDELAPIAFENGEGSFLIRTHQPRIPGNVGAEDGRQSPFNAFFRHDASRAAV
jgi:hypothetical protein